MRTIRFLGVVFAAPLMVALAYGPAARAQASIGVNFGATSTNGPGNPNVPMDPTETAGVVAQANWNSISGSSGGADDRQHPPVALLDDLGNPTGAMLIYWSSPNDWTLNLNGSAVDDAHMMKGYLDTTDHSTTTVVITGIPYSNYDVYVYSTGQNDTGTADRQAVIAVNDPGFQNPLTALSPMGEIFGITTTTYTLGQEYVVFPGESGATLLVEAAADPNFGTNGGVRGPLNAIQIVSLD